VRCACFVANYRAAIDLEWFRRRGPIFDKECREFLFKGKAIVHD
jgi:hypothetical protein